MSMIIAKQLGERIKELRQEKKWTQRDLGNALGFTAVAIGSWEHGRTTPSMNSIKEIAKLFDVPVDYIVGNIVTKADGSEEAKALLKVAENEINQLKDEKEKLIIEVADKNLKLKGYVDGYKELKDENVDLKNEITFLKGLPAVVREDRDETKRRIDELMEENARLKDTIVHMAMKGALN